MDSKRALFARFATCYTGTHSMKAVFFDLDGTLIDSRADLATAVNLTRREFGLPELPAGLLTSYVGEGLRRLVARAMPANFSRLDEAVACARVQYGVHLLDRTALYPGVADALRMLGAHGWKRAVVTNKPREFIRPILDGLGVAGEFETLVGGGDTAVFKPDPAPVLLAAARLGIADLRGSWAAGDHFTDMEAGRRLGLQRCFCRYGFGELRGEGFDLAVDSLVELARHVGCEGNGCSENV
jgi:phosphoglycolate phosphatase